MISNMRDLGGTRTMDGKKIRKGCLIRSAFLPRAEEEDLRGVSAIIDLRTPGERSMEPDQTCGRRYYPLPVFTDEQAGVSHEGSPGEWDFPDLEAAYGLLIDKAADSFRRIVLKIMEHDYSAGAILWHCTEGKDRCGITAALVLESLGVDRAVIMEDYLKTNQVNIPKAEAIRERMAETRGKEFADRVYQAYIADERYLRAAWDAMGEDYITGKLGIDERTIRDFRAAVLE